MHTSGIIIDQTRFDKLESEVETLKGMFSEYIVPQLSIPKEPVLIDLVEAARLCGYKSTKPIKLAITKGDLIAQGTVGKHKVLLSALIKWRDSK